MAEGAQNESDILKHLLYDDMDSEQKRRMRDGEWYYNGEHDILQKDFTGSKLLGTSTFFIAQKQPKQYDRFRTHQRSN